MKKKNYLKGEATKTGVDCWVDLAYAILHQAARDYMMYSEKNDVIMKEDVAVFFRSKWCEIISEGRLDYIPGILDELAKG